MRLAAVTLVAHSVNVFRDVESEASEPDASGFLEHAGVEAAMIVISEFFTSVSFFGFWPPAIHSHSLHWRYRA